jgi:PAS domain S-box-containing protein
MGAKVEEAANEIKRLKACINNLISVQALPAIWSGGQPSQIVSALLDMLLEMLSLDFAYARLKDSTGGAPLEMVRLAQDRNLTAQPQMIGRALNSRLGDFSRTAPLIMRNPIGDGDVSVLLLRLGLQAEMGVFVAGSKRADFPTQTERLLLNVAANQAAIGLQEARLFGEQKRVTEELDQRVARRTGQLLAANEELEKEIAERKRGEALFTGEKRLLEMIATGVALKEILNDLCLIIEEFRSGTLVSVLLLRPDGLHLDSVAGPSLPKGWTQQMENLPIGPCAGSCGTAAYRGSPVIVSDIATDPLWNVPEHRASALGHGLRASWSNPVLSSDGKVLGTFCMYYRETRSPNSHDLGLIEMATHLVRVAIERDRAEEALRRSEGFLADGQRISHTGTWGWNLSTGKLTWSDEHFRIFGFDPEKTEPSFQLFLETVHPEDRSFIERGLDEAIREKSGFDMEFRIALTDGSIKNVQGVGRPVFNESGDIDNYIGTTVDITARKRAEALLAGEKHLLEMVARGDSLTLILDALCRLVEELAIGALSSILLLEPNGNRLRHGAAPSLPPAYIDAIDGAAIGPSAGSCGTAAYRAKPVIVSDIADDPLWTNYRDVALPHGLRACWSTPILSSEGNVLGTFAIYYREPRTPTPPQLEIIEQVTHLASIALERKRAENAVRASEQVARGQVEALVQSLDILATAPPPEKFIGQMLSTIGRLLNAQSVIFWLLDETSDSVVLRAGAHGSNLAAIEHEHPFVKDGLSWKHNPGLQEMFFTGVPIVCEDIEDDPRVGTALRDYFRLNGTKKFLTIPTLVGSRVNGFIGIRHGDRQPYRPEEIELAQALAHQAMFAIQLNEFAKQSEQAAVLEERNRMARDIHDTLAQGLTGVIVQLQAAEDATSKGYKKDARNHLQNAQALARYGLNEARRSVRALRPQALEDATFWEALKGLIKSATVGTPLQTDFQLRGKLRELPPMTQENLLHIGQEALTNTLKYAQATRFETRLSFKAKEVRLDLRDNGVGFKVNNGHSGFGLSGMQERVEQIGGSLTIASARGQGTKIVVVLPCEQDVVLQTLPQESAEAPPSKGRERSRSQAV